VTHRGAGPIREHPPYEWELRNPRFNGQKRSQKRAIAIDLGFAEIWLGQSLVNGARATDLKPLQRVAARSYQGLQIDKRPGELVFSGVSGLFSEVRVGGCRKWITNFGNGALPGQGFHHFDRLFALPRSHDWASVPPLQTAPSLRDKDFP
jgi:hypothetical protein